MPELFSYIKRPIIVLLALIVLAPSAYAVEPDEVLQNPVQEQRARKISEKLRCLVCQNQNIDSSDAPLAKDLRVLVRERIEAGDTDEGVVAYVVDRYGEFVLLQPKFAWHTLLLWGTPLVVLVAGILLFAKRRRTQQAPATPNPLSSEETEQITKILRERE